jgi:hypothetical protein
MIYLPKTDDSHRIGRYIQHFAWFKCEACGDVYNLRKDVGKRWEHCGCLGGKKLDKSKRIDNGNRK